MWENILQPGRPQLTIRRMRIAYWITKATNTHSEYVILTAFPPQQWLHERASMLRNTYTACLVLSLHETDHLQLYSHKDRLLHKSPSVYLV